MNNANQFTRIDLEPGGFATGYIRSLTDAPQYTQRTIARHGAGGAFPKPCCGGPRYPGTSAALVSEGHTAKSETYDVVPRQYLYPSLAKTRLTEAKFSHQHPKRPW